MKVSIDCDRRVKFRGSDEYEGGWYYYKSPPRPFDEEFDVQKTRERWDTYAEAKQAAIAAGHELSLGGWKHRMLSWNFTSHSLQDYPGWETTTGDHNRPVPAYVKLTHTYKKEGADQSDELCRAWDDLAEVDFYQRDHTSDGIPWCSDGDTYWSSWWFASFAERDRFVKWCQDRGVL